MRRPASRRRAHHKLYFTLAPGANQERRALSPGGVVSDRIDEGELDSYTFTAQTGEGIVMRLTDVSAGPLLPAFNVYDPSGAVVARAENTDVAATNFTTQASGTFTVVVYDASNGAAATGPYNLYFTRAPGADKGGALSPGGVVSGQIVEGAIDSYTFSAQAGEGVQLRVTDVSAGPLLPGFIIYDPTGAAVGQAVGEDVAGFNLSAPASGTFTVVVFDGTNGATGTGLYKMYFTLAPGADTGGALSPGSAVSGQIDEGELDSYTFAAQVGDKVTTTVTDTSGSSPLVPTVTVYDPIGTAINEAQDANVASSTFTVQKSGTFTVIVGDGSNALASTGPYSLLLSVIPAGS